METVVGRDFALKQFGRDIVSGQVAAQDGRVESNVVLVGVRRTAAGERSPHTNARLEFE